eukprot:scaffold299449_cov18-Tisochrysis_lutea.AAC.1
MAYPGCSGHSMKHAESMESLMTGVGVGGTGLGQQNLKMCHLRGLTACMTLLVPNTDHLLHCASRCLRAKCAGVGGVHLYGRQLIGVGGVHLYGRRLVVEYAKDEEGLDELRSKTAAKFKGDDAEVLAPAAKRLRKGL